MSKIKFGLGALQAAQENYQIILDRLIRGYQKMMKKDPEGLDLIKIKQEARQRADESAKVVDMKGRTLNPEKPIMGGTQETRSLEELLEGEKRLAKKESKELMDNFGVQMEDPTKANYVDPESEEGIDVYNKYMRKKYNEEKFGEGIKGIYDEAKGPGKGDEMVEALKSPGARASTDIIEKQLQETFPDIKLFGDETFEEILEIQKTGKHPRMKAEGGIIGEVQNLINAGLKSGSDLASGAGKFILGAASGIPGAGLLLAGLGQLGQPTISNLAQQNFLDASGAEVDDIGRLTSGIMQGYNTRFDLSPRARARISALEKLNLTPSSRTRQDARQEKINQLNEFIAQQEAAQAAAAAAASDSQRAREAFLSISQGDGGYSGSSGPTSAGAGMGVGGGYASDYGFAKGGLATMFTRKR